MRTECPETAVWDCDPRERARAWVDRPTWDRRWEPQLPSRPCSYRHSQPLKLNGVRPSVLSLLLLGGKLTEVVFG